MQSYMAKISGPILEHAIDKLELATRACSHTIADREAFENIRAEHIATGI